MQVLFPADIQDKIVNVERVLIFMIVFANLIMNLKKYIHLPNMYVNLKTVDPTPKKRNANLVKLY